MWQQKGKYDGVFIATSNEKKQIYITRARKLT